MPLHQEFRTVCPGCKAYLTLHTVDTEVDSVTAVRDDITEQPPLTPAPVGAADVPSLANAVLAPRCTQDDRPGLTKTADERIRDLASTPFLVSAAGCAAQSVGGSIGGALASAKGALTNQATHGLSALGRMHVAHGGLPSDRGILDCSLCQILQSIKEAIDCFEARVNGTK